MPDDTLKVQGWIDLSQASLQHNFERARDYGDSAVALATRLGFTKGIAFGHRQMGAANYYAGHLDEAFQDYQVALAFYRQTGDAINEAKILNNIGLVKRSQARHDEAMEYFFQALEIKEQLRDTNSLAYSYSTIGETYAIKGDFEKAESYFLQALEGFRAVDNQQMANTMLLNLGGFYRDQGDFDKALEYVMASKAYFDQNGPKREVARIYYILGGLHLSKNELDKGAQSFQTAKIHYDSLGAAMQSIGCMLNLSRIALKQGKSGQAKDQAKQSLEMAKNLGTREQVATALELLSDIYREEGNYQQALSFLEDYHQVQDSISSEQSRRTIAELEEKYQSEQKERQLAELTATNQANEFNLAKQQGQKRLLAIFALLVVVIALLLFSLYQAKKRHNKIIQTSLDEKEVLLREIHHRVKNNLQFISSLLSLQTRHVSDPKTLEVLLEGNNRINSMALVHQKLYQEHNLTGVDMPSYISNLLDSLLHAYKIDRTRVAIQAQIDELVLDIDTATPIGLILNELITNAFKYAFADRPNGILQISLTEREGSLQLGIRDNGKGLPPDFNLAESPQFGFELVRSLARQLKAEIVIENQQGTAITLKIAKYQNF